MDLAWADLSVLAARWGPPQLPHGRFAAPMRGSAGGPPGLGQYHHHGGGTLDRRFLAPSHSVLAGAAGPRSGCWKMSPARSAPASQPSWVRQRRQGAAAARGLPLGGGGAHLQAAPCLLAAPCIRASMPPLRCCSCRPQRRRQEHSAQRAGLPPGQGVGAGGQGAAEWADLRAGAPQAHRQVGGHRASVVIGTCEVGWELVAHRQVGGQAESVYSGCMCGRRWCCIDPVSPFRWCSGSTPCWIGF